MVKDKKIIARVRQNKTNEQLSITIPKQDAEEQNIEAGDYVEVKKH